MSLTEKHHIQKELYIRNPSYSSYMLSHEAMNYIYVIKIKFGYIQGFSLNDVLKSSEVHKQFP